MRKNGIMSLREVKILYRSPGYLDEDGSSEWWKEVSGDLERIVMATSDASASRIILRSWDGFSGFAHRRGDPTAIKTAQIIRAVWKKMRRTPKLIRKRNKRKT